MSSLENAKKIVGLGISSGLALARVFKIQRPKELIAQKSWQKKSPATEWTLLNEALNKSTVQITELSQRARELWGSSHAAIFEAHLEILKDPEWLTGIQKRIQAEVPAPEALNQTSQEFINIFESLEDPYMRERAQDIRDLTGRVLLNLFNESPFDLLRIQSPVILVADEIFPSEVAQFNPTVIQGVVTQKGGVTSHSAILLKNIEIPAVFGLKESLDHFTQDSWLFVNGTEGFCLSLKSSQPTSSSSFNPSSDPLPKPLSNPTAYEPSAQVGNSFGEHSQEVLLQELRKEIQEWKTQRAELGKIKDLKTQTKDGQNIKLLTNLSSLADIAKAKAAGAMGVGLFRTEFLFLERTQAPSEDEQFKIYKELLESFVDQPVVIRTLDIGGDKSAPYLGTQLEENPFLGLRGVRFCLKNLELFKTQLRALLRASAYGSLSVMVPMVSDVSEVLEVKAILSQIKEELLGEAKNELQKSSTSVEGNPPKANPQKIKGLSSDSDFRYEFGIMIEVPAAALLLEDFLPHVDFVSIGTNDLTQYLLAADRMNPEVNHLCNHSHPAVKNLVRQIIQVVQKSNKKVSICGEMAGDEKLTNFLLESGLDTFSVSRSQILPVKRKILDFSKIVTN